MYSGFLRLLNQVMRLLEFLQVIYPIRIFWQGLQLLLSDADVMQWAVRLPDCSWESIVNDLLIMDEFKETPRWLSDPLALIGGM
jgi:hypothetical protein